MKKLLTLIFALLLCCSVLFASCDEEDKNSLDTSEQTTECSEQKIDPEEPPTDTEESTSTPEESTTGREDNPSEDAPSKESVGLAYAISQEGQTCAIIGIGTCTDTEIYIPAKIDGYSVTVIRLGAFNNCNMLTNITLPEGIISIEEDAFSGCINLTSITIPNSVTNIDEFAFRGCIGLTNVKIPKSVTNIGVGAFYMCANLTSITVDSNNANYMSIDGNVYSKDGKTLIQYAAGKTATSFIVPDSVTCIGEGAFLGCTELTSITIPDSLKSIASSAFVYSGLKNVYYSGTASKWGEICSNPTNDMLINATVYYYSESIPTEEGNYWHYVDGVPTPW